MQKIPSQNQTKQDFQKNQQRENAQDLKIQLSKDDQVQSIIKNFSKLPCIKLDFLQVILFILKISHAFGALFSTQATDCLSFLQEDPLKICYPVGRHIAIKQFGIPQMIFLRQHEQIQRITAMKLTPNHRYMCISSKIRGDNAAYLTFYDFYDPQCKTIKTRLKFEDQTGQTTKEVVSLNFSADSRFVGALSAFPDSTAAVWEWEVKNGFLGSHILNDHVTRITLHPQDPRRACTSGRNHWKLWQVQENSFKQLNTFVGIDEGKNYTDHVWLTPEVIIGVTDYGQIYILQNYEVKQYIKYGFGEFFLNCTKLLVFSHGLLISSEDGHIAIYQQSSEPPQKSNKKGAFHASLPPAIQQGGQQSPASNKSDQQQNPFSYFYHYVHCFSIPQKQGSKIITMTLDTQQNVLGVAYKDNGLAIVRMESIYKDAQHNEIQSRLIQNISPSSKPMMQIQSGINSTVKSNQNFSSTVSVNSAGATGTAGAATGAGMHQQRESLIKFELLQGGYHSGKIAAIDIATQRPLIATCSKQDLNVKIWNYITLKCEISYDLSSGPKLNPTLKTQQSDILPSKLTKDASGKQISCLALHPSGYYLAVGFQDKVKLYHILNQSLREYYSLHIKLSPLAKFSNGGHLFAAVDQKYVKVYNSYSLQLLINLVGPNQTINDLVFSRDDRLMAICSGNGGYVYVWETRRFERLYEDNARNCNFRAISFYKGDIIAGGNDGSGAVLRTLSKGLHQPITGVEQQKRLLDFQASSDLDLQKNVVNTSTNMQATSIIKPSSTIPTQTVAYPTKHSTDGKVTATLELESLHGLRTLIVGTDRGYMRLHSLPLQDQKYIDYFNAHYGEVIMMKSTPDSRLVITAGDDGAIFLYSVTEYGPQAQILGAQDYIPTKQIRTQEVMSQSDRQVQEALDRGKQVQKLKFNDQATMIVDMDIADVLLVQKSDLQEYKNRLENLKHDLQELETRVEQVKQPGTVNSIHQELIQTAKRMQMQKEQWEKRYQELQREKDQQQKQNAQKLQKSETLHKQAKQELQTIYSKRLQIEVESLRKLQKDYSGMVDDYDKRLKGLKGQYKQAVDRLLVESKSQLQKDQEEYDQTKKTSDDLKMIYEQKLSQQEDEHQAQIQQLRKKHDQRIRELQLEIAKIKNSNDGLQRAKKQLSQEKQGFQNDNNSLKKQLSGLTQKHHDKKQKALNLESNKKQIAQQLNQKEKQIFNLKFQIKNLQKTKQVLSFKTNEMRESLEPKQKHIEKLKNNLLQLEQNFQREIKARNMTHNKLQEKKQQIKSLKAKISNQLAVKKQKQKLIDEFTNDIHTYTKSKDEKMYIIHMRQLYSRYVQPVRKELLQKLNKDPQTMAEMQRQVKYMNQSIVGLKGDAFQSEKKSKTYMHKKTLENTDLIHRLNALRLQIKNLKSQNDLLQIKLQKYDQIRKDNTKNKVQTKFGSALLGNIGKSQYGKRYLGGGVGQNASTMPQLPNRPSTASRLKGKLFKGTPFDYKKFKFQEKQKISELQSQIEENSQIILYQNLEIKRLKQKLLSILEMKEEGLKDSNLQGGGMILPQVGDSPDIGVQKQYQNEDQEEEEEQLEIQKAARVARQQ